MTTLFFLIMFCIFMNLFCYEILSLMTAILFFKSLTMFQNTSFMTTYHSTFGSCDKINSLLMILTLFIFMISFLASNLVTKFNNFSYSIIMNTMLITLIFLFFTSSFLSMYIYFEFSILPIFLIIMGWGYQTERVSASLALMFYTVSASMPLLIFIMNILFKDVMYMSQFSFKLSFNFSSSFFLLSAVLAFLVKLPIFLAHLWLPKAHVEAPVVGSMILASILLKLGGYGLIRVTPLISMNYLLNFLISISLTGSALIGLICLNQLDMKVIIAYSSVAHMGLVIGSMMYFTSISLTGSLMLMVAHGISSSSMFFGGNLLYLRSFSRSILLSKGILGSSPLISFLWLFTMLSSMAAPPMINLISEIVCISSIMSFSIYNILWMGLAVFLAGAYSMILYSSTQQSNYFNNTMTMKFTSFNEMLILFIHVFWVLSAVLGMNLFTSM